MKIQIDGTAIACSSVLNDVTSMNRIGKNSSSATSQAATLRIASATR